MKDKYPEFHIFYFKLKRAKQIQQNSTKKLATMEDTDGYNNFSLIEFYYIIQHRRLGTSEEIKSDPIFTALSNPELHDEQVEKIIALLNQYQVTFGELFLWLKLFE